MATFFTRDGAEISSRAIPKAEPSGFAPGIYLRYLMLAAALAIAFDLAAVPLAHARHSTATPTPTAVLSAHRLTAEAPFLAENNQAMNKMMAAMSVAPTGDVDIDFAATMIPHHQGAIDMAIAELHFGKNEKLRRIAQEIVVDQEQEIAAMRMAIGQPLLPSAPAPTQMSTATKGSVPRMTMQMNAR